MTETNRNSPAIVIRAGSVEDANLLSRLGARLFEETFGADNTPEDMQAYLAEAFAPDRQAAELADAARTTFIAEDTAGTAVGYAVLIRGETLESIDGAHPAELRRIYVDRSRHGRRTDGEARGAGALLLDRCVEQARSWGCDVIWLAVWERNQRALRFYEKHAFQQVGQKTFQLGADLQYDFVMARNL